jgi:hypothetical protein
MAFQSQFSLSLELTRLLPVRSITDQAAQAFMNYARQLYHSGSDVIVEEDLVQIFGRSKISTTLGSSFKTVVAESTSSASLWEGIMLQAGPGPTVARSLRETPYFAMVVQLSLLTWSYEAAYVATGLADALQKRTEGGTSTFAMPTSPSRESILKVLRACETQTSAFNWNMLLQAVAKTLGCSITLASGSLPSTILQGALDMFPLVQSLPQDRIVHIRLPEISEDKDATDSVICFFVVWTHQVLDLTVIVRRIKTNSSKKKTMRFGQGSIDQVIIEEVPSCDEPGITLLDSLGENLLAIKPEPDIEALPIGSISRVPAKGWGNAIILESLTNDPACVNAEEKAVIEELQIITSAFSQIIARHLFHDDFDRLPFDGAHPSSSSDFRNQTANIPLHVGQCELLKASRFLFDNPHLSQRAVDSYLSHYSSRPLNDDLPLPTTFQSSSRRRGLSDRKIADGWNILCRELLGCSIYIIAFAHVLNLEDCENLMFSGAAASEIAEHGLSKQLEDWDGRHNLYIGDGAWLQAIAVPLLGQRTRIWNLPWDRVCLVSDRGWSAWIPTFGDEDPAYTKAGSLFVNRGSPCRNGIWKSGVWDMPQQNWSFMTDPRKAEASGQQASLRCAQEVSFMNPFCGEGEDIFLVYARFKQHCEPDEQKIQRVGYRELQKSLWWAQITSKCHHGAQNISIKLPLGCATLMGFGHHVEDAEERILVCLTADSVGARWLALVSFAWTSTIPLSSPDEGPPHLLLRRKNCCFQCAIDQAALKPGRWFLIL